MSKGSRQRPTKVTVKEADLRWELISKNTTAERREQIIKLLEEIKNETK